jgi:ATP-dependent Zn protease
MVPNRRKATAYHEAGHAVIAWRLGAHPRSVTIVPKGEVQGETVQESPFIEADFVFDGSDHARNRVERAIIICLAGPMAQRRFAPRSWRRWHGGPDYVVAFDLALRVNGSPAAAKVHMKWLEMRAQALLESVWSYVEAIASELLKRGTLSAEEIRSILLPMHKVHS